MTMWFVVTSISFSAGMPTEGASIFPNMEERFAAAN